MYISDRKKRVHRRDAENAEKRILVSSFPLCDLCGSFSLLRGSPATINLLHVSSITAIV
jgi:hypothetical protein